MFKPPTIQEVTDYIKYRQPSWPDEFVDHISEKFYFHYQSCGWRLSSNVLVKDWQACFNSRWKSLPYEEDRRKLEECRKKQASIPSKTNLVSTDKTIDYIEDLLSQFKTGNFDWHDLATPYKWLLESRIMTFSDEERNKLVADAGNNKEWGRYLSVKLFFSRILKDNLTFSEYINKRKTA